MLRVEHHDMLMPQVSLSKARLDMKCALTIVWIFGYLFDFFQMVEDGERSPFQDHHKVAWKQADF